MFDPGKVTTSDEDRAFLQRRVALAGLVAGSSFGTFFLYRTAIGLGFEVYAEFENPSYALHGLATAIFFAMWLVARSGTPSVPRLRAVETSGFLLSSVAVIFMAYFIPLEARPDMIATSSLTYALMARSVFVPSSGRRSFTLASIVGAVLIATIYLHWLEADIEAWKQAGIAVNRTSQRSFAFWGAVTSLVWWSLTVIIATAASRVIYGLRKEVKDARQLGQYHLDAKLGEGGMGTVYAARHAFLRRPAAIKLLRPELAGEKNIRRFETEVQRTAQLSHPNTVTVFDYGHTSDGIFYYAMELIDGADLERLIKVGGAQSSARVRHFLSQVASALVHAHGTGLIHRDIKPGNIMVTLPHRFGGATDIVKLVDFGLVKELQTGGGLELTQTNIVSGTPLYLSPEAITSPEKVDGRSDLYAVGAVGYYLLTGRSVFEAESVVEVCGHHLHTKPVPPSTHVDTIPAELESIILDCLEKEPSDRPSSAHELQVRLERCTAAGVWTPDDALNWWDDHEEALTEVSTSHSPAIQLTLDIARSRKG